MNELQIKYFLAVVECRSFSQAAIKLYVSRPAISKQIAALEKELEVTLFERSNKLTLLTKSGNLFYDCFKRIEQDIANTSIKARQAMGQDEKMHARLAFFIDWDIDFLMSPLTRQLKEEYPQLSLEFESRSKFDIGATVNNSKFDATICFNHLVPNDHGGKISSHYLTDVRRMLFCSANHPLVHKPDLQLTDFKDVPCITLFAEKQPEPSRTIRQICAFHGFEPNFDLKPNHDSVVMAVQSGYGYCIFDEWSRNRTSSSFYSMPLDFPRPVSMFWRNENTNPAIPIIKDTLDMIFNARGKEESAST